MAAATDLQTGSVQAASASDYVVVAGAIHSGLFAVSEDHDTVALIGWNDRIRSFKGLNSGRGLFWTDWHATGSSLSFCCNVNDPSLPSTFDTQNTSVYRP